MGTSKLVVSPVGISLFFNVLGREENDLRQQLNLHSNDAQLPQELESRVAELEQRAMERLRTGGVQERRRLSAELNGLYALYQDNLTSNGDLHLLVGTDTYLGKRALHIIEEFLREEIHLATMYEIPQKLNTASLADFSSGIKSLLDYFERTIPEYGNKGYQIVFNLTGGFKSLQGYLNIIGMFYADQLVYIFEGGRELLTIPKLPLKVDEDSLAEYADELVRLAAGGIYPRSKLRSPDALLEVDEKGDATISNWGLLVWNRTKDNILRKELLDLPFLEYENTFRREFNRADRELCIKLQETLARVSVLLEGSNGDITVLKRDGGLRYDNYTGVQLSGGVPVGHFRIDQANRVTCVYQSGKLYLRHFGSHDYTERVEGVK